MVRVFKSKFFNYNQDFHKINFRKQPEKYQVGRGEQGVLMVEPYKSEILPHWRFKTPEIAQKSAKKIYALFLAYKKDDDFVGMDMSRKFLQMGYTRSRRYANHPTGKKFASNPQLKGTKLGEKKARANVLPQAADWANSPKAESARIFYGYYLKAKSDRSYLTKKKIHQQKHG